MIDLKDAESTHNLKGKRILWVEDDKFLNDIITQKLSHEEVSVFSANNGEDALKIAKNEKLDAIMLDIMLPGMDGIEILTHLKEDPTTKDIPVVMFSNLDDKTKIEKAMSLGAKGFFIKASMTLEETMAKVSEIISK